MCYNNQKSKQGVGYMVKCYVSPFEMNQKPTGYMIRKLSKDMTNHLVELSLEQFAEELTVKGKTTVLCEYEPHIDSLSKTTEIVQQELVMLDFDNKQEPYYTIKDLENDLFMQQNALFYYRTFSDTESSGDKFRVVFKLDMLAKNIQTVSKIYTFLFNQYPQSDKSVGQTSRMFFGSNSGYSIINWDNVIDVEAAIQELLPTVDESIRVSEQDIEILDENGNKIKPPQVYKVEPTDIQANHNREDITLDTPNYLLFKYFRFDLLKKKYGTTYSANFADDYSATNYFTNKDMVDFLDLPQEPTFHDILHKEETPSAGVFYAKEHDIYLYKCFSESHPFTGNVLLLLTQYLNQRSTLRTLLLVVEATNSRISFTDELGMSKRESEIFRKELLDGKLKYSYPNLYEYLKQYALEINATLDFMFDFLYEDPQTGEIQYLNYYSMDKLATLVGNATKQKISTVKMKTILSTLVVTDLVRKVPVSDIPQDIHEKLLLNQKISEHNLRLSNVYTPMKNTQVEYLAMEEIAKTLLDNNIYKRTLSYETVYRILGEEKAKKTFPQAYEPLIKRNLIEMSDKDSNLTKKSVDFEDKIVKFIFKELDSKGYIFEKDLLNKLAISSRKKVANIKSNYMRKIGDICNKYGLTRELATKETYEKLNIESGSKLAKNIIYKEQS